MNIKYDVILDELREEDAGVIPQYDTDPSAPAQETAWVLKTFSGGGAGSGEAYGLLLTLTQPGDGATTTYQFSYRTKEDTTVRVSLT